MFTWAGKRKQWRLLFELNPVEEVDIARLLPVDYQDWSERVLNDGEIIELRNRFETIRNAWDLHEGLLRGRLAKPMPREHAMACWIMLGTLARVNELCAARWVHVDFSKATWFIPPEQAKNRKGFTHPRHQHIGLVPGDGDVQVDARVFDQLRIARIEWYCR